MRPGPAGWGLAGVLALGAFPRAGAQGPGGPASGPGGPASGPVPVNEALEFYAQEARVVTASRREESRREAPVSVAVITAEDIRASGAVNLWDLLRFRRGLDVFDSNTDGIGVVTIRGFAQRTIKQLQVLVDGRSVISTSRSEVNWEQVPVQLQDIERIEIVRGPNAALYGSNAGFGVIHILTKKPGAGSLSAASRGGSGGFYRTEAAAEGAAKDFRFRASQTHSARDGTALAGGGSLGDFLFSNKQNFRGVWSPAAGTTLDLCAGGSWDTLSSTLGRQRRYRGHFEQARLTQEAGSGELELTGARSETLTAEERSLGLLSLRELQYDAEALYRAPWLDERLHTVAGASYRLALAQSDQMFAGAPKQRNDVARGFLSQRVPLSDLLTLAASVSLERSGTSGYEPAYQAATILSPEPEHAFRLSYAFAPTLPSLLDKGANFRTSATGARVGNPGLDSEHLHSYEAGYSGLFASSLSVGLDLYYLDQRDLNESVVVSQANGVTTRTAANANRALARGLEASLELKLPERREVYANYTYENVSDSVGDPSVSDSIPTHKLNLGGRAALPRGFSVSTNLGYKDAYHFGLAAYWRLDARLAYSPRPGVELFLAGQNLTETFHGPELRGAPAVPRSYQGGLAVGF